MLSAAVLWVQLGEELQHRCQADYEAQQHVLLSVHGKLRELEGPGRREQMEQHLEQQFLEFWLVAEWKGGLAVCPSIPGSSLTAAWASSSVLPTCAKQKSALAVQGSWYHFILLALVA